MLKSTDWKSILAEVNEALRNDERKFDKENDYKPFEVIEPDQKDKDLADFFREQGLL